MNTQGDERELLDKFALKVLPSVFRHVQANHAWYKDSTERITAVGEWSYQIAESMLKARNMLAARQASAQPDSHAGQG